MLSRLTCIIAVALLMLQLGCSYKSPVPVDVSEPEMDDYTRGLLDGDFDAHGNQVWILSGCALSALGPIVAWGEMPNPREHALLGKSQDYVRGYTYAYQNKSRVKNTNYAWKGFGIGCFFNCIFMVLTNPPSLSN